MARRVGGGILAAMIVSLCAGGIMEPSAHEGFFGISGIIPDKSYLEELRVDCATSGFWIGPEAGYVGSRKEALHTEQMRSFVELGIAPIATFYAGNVNADHAGWAEEIVRYYTTGAGAAEAGAPVVYWEIGDEENGGWGTGCDPEEYARRVSILAPGIRAACPECKIVLGGLLDGPEMGEWALVPYLDRFLDAGGGDWIDVYAFHYFGLACPSDVLPEAQLYDTARGIVSGMEATLVDHGLEGAPIWVTETSTFSGAMGGIEQSESDQAADLVKRYALLWSLGVQRVLWTYLTEPQYEGTGVGFFDQAGLVYDGLGPYDGGLGVKKRAYYAYLYMLDRLGSAALVESRSLDGVTILRFSAPTGSVTLVWQDPWVRRGPIWCFPEGEVTQTDLVGHGDERRAGPFRIDLGLEPIYLLGAQVSISLTAPALTAP
jgi:hypothetical protein